MRIKARALRDSFAPCLCCRTVGVTRCYDPPRRFSPACAGTVYNVELTTIFYYTTSSRDFSLFVHWVKPSWRDRRKTGRKTQGLCSLNIDRFWLASGDADIACGHLVRHLQIVGERYLLFSTLLIVQTYTSKYEVFFLCCFHPNTCYDFLTSLWQNT